MKTQTPTKTANTSAKQASTKSVRFANNGTPKDPAMVSDLDEGYYSDREDLKRTVHALGVNKKYVQSWSKQDAFRELCQNWCGVILFGSYVLCKLLTAFYNRKDAIMLKFNLNQRSFKPELKELTDEIQIIVYTPTSTEQDQRKLLGYILFNHKEGCLEITNFDGRLTRDNLELGVSTKHSSNTTAGTHGEGLKLAALVLVRAEHRLRLTSHNFNWTFGFRGPKKSIFQCRLTPVPPTQMNAAQKISGNLKANPLTDVSILVDKERGGKKISGADFRTWIKVVLDIERLQNPADVIETPHGDLILDQSYAGKMYLKGLLLASGGSTSKTQRVGYNLLRGQVGRDRQQLKNEDEEARTLMSIWGSAIETRGEHVL